TITKCYTHTFSRCLIHGDNRAWMPQVVQPGGETFPELYHLLTKSSSCLAISLSQKKCSVFALYVAIQLPFFSTSTKRSLCPLERVSVYRRDLRPRSSIMSRKRSRVRSSVVHGSCASFTHSFFCS